MAITLFYWHPQRGVHHFVWDTPDQVSTHIKSMEQREAGCVLPPLSFYCYTDDYDAWWYYCQPPEVHQKKHMILSPSNTDPWQRRSPEGVPKEIRAYKLLLG